MNYQGSFIYHANATKFSCVCADAVLYYKKEGKSMGKKEKLIKRLKSKPKDFTFEEATVLLNYLEYQQYDKGKTSGSRVIFKSENYPPIMLHKPHPNNELKAYQIKQLVQILESEGLI